ncbi:MAG: flagellar hook-associated protein FlgK [Methylovulum sp.]|nr:flagellar hook-associated protein FlgK [Methylovulum sp.]MCF7998899.1 flagellar hook-associated protein FlgK [Methylovulum sp.]
MAGMLGISSSGLMAVQQALDVTSHNIANVNTDGYSRQRVDFTPKSAQSNGGGFIGQGVDATVSRVYDQFIAKQMTSTTSAFSEADTLSTYAAQVDNMVSSDATSVSGPLNSFFNAVNDVANDPSSLAARQVMLEDARSVSHQFNTLSTQFDDVRQQTNSQMGAMLDDINSYTKNIADLNDKIVLASSRATDGQLPNDLLDQRDTLINKIAEKFSVTTQPQQDGSVNLFISSGQYLVMGNSATNLSLGDSTTAGTDKAILADGVDITKQISGGQVSGLLKFQHTVLDPAQQQLDLMAVGFAAKFNDIHNGNNTIDPLQTKSFDLNGKPGKDFFDVGSPTVKASTDSFGTVSATYDATRIGMLTADNYQLNYDGNAYSLTRLSDNTVTNVTVRDNPNDSKPIIEGPGFNIEITQDLAAGDSFLIKPVNNAANNLKSLIDDPAQIAASSTAAGVPGDNANALKLAELANTKLMLGGNASINDINSQMVAKIGTLANSAKVNSAAQESLFNMAKQSRESLSGVNLDEEAANLIKYKQAYQAAAQAISTASTLFDTLINAMR